MKHAVMPSLAIVFASLCAMAIAGDLTSGLQVGESPGAFNVKDITGPAKGTSLCYRWRYGARPVVNIFAREITDNLTSMVKQLDKVVGDNKNKNMAGFFVLLTDDPDAAEEKLAALAKKEGIQNIPLTVFDGMAGPPSYKISKDADVTVHMWTKMNVKANHAFAKNGLNEKAVKEVVADTKKILE